ncbi:uncharacterized protein [Panulirus ornatus]|uniref:uncharacterized protein n=1 Tax=Panulirus ornatus TaxID=150431 RepID=UPI003A83B47E
MGIRQPKLGPTHAPSVFTPLTGQQNQQHHSSHRSRNERKHGNHGKHFHGRNPVRVDIASSAYRDRTPSRTVGSNFFEHFPVSALHPGTTLAIAHAHARGPNAHAQAHAQARLHNFG